MDGLEAVEIKFSYVEKQSSILRFDSNFYLKEFLYEENLILNAPHYKIVDIRSDIKSFGAYSLNNFFEYQDSGVPFVRGINLRGGMVDFSDMVFIDNQANQLLYKSVVKPEMILMSMSGTIGDLAIAEKDWDYPINSNQDIAKIVIDRKKCNPYMVYAFLRTKFGQNNITREGRGSVQQHIFLSQIDELLIPHFTDKFQSSIEETIVVAQQKLKESKALYKEAEETLLSALGLTNYVPTEDNVIIKSLSESFGESGRLDSEFYQPRYDEIENAIRNYSGGADILSNQMKSISSGEYSDGYAEFDSVVNKIFYIRNSNMSNGEIVVEGDYYINPASFNKFVTKGDIVTSRVGTIGLFASINEDISGSAYSDNVLCISPNASLSSDAYTLYFNSMPNQILLERISKGSVQPLVTQTDIKNILIPLLEEALQKDLEKLVKKSYQLQQESKHLLDLAKRSVELAIEKDEETAMQLIKQSIK